MEYYIPMTFTQLVLLLPYVYSLEGAVAAIPIGSIVRTVALVL